MIKRIYKTYIGRVGEKRSDQIKHDDGKERGRRKETTIELLMKTNQATNDTHDEGECNYNTILSAELSIHLKHEIAKCEQEREIIYKAMQAAIEPMQKRKENVMYIDVH